MHYLTFKTDAWLWFGPCLYKLVCRYATVNNFTLRVEYFKQSSSIKKLGIKMGKPSSCLAPKSCCSDRKWNWYDWLDVVKVEILSSGSQLHLHNLTFVLFGLCQNENITWMRKRLKTHFQHEQICCQFFVRRSNVLCFSNSRPHRLAFNLNHFKRPWSLRLHFEHSLFTDISDGDWNF